MYVSTYCTVLFLVIVACFGAPFKMADGCGYESCSLGKPDKLNVHLVPHSHDDAGWLKTIDQYYYGEVRKSVTVDFQPKIGRGYRNSDVKPLRSGGRGANYVRQHPIIINSRNNIAHGSVQYILDSVIEALDENPDRRFIYVEIAFFWRWWNEQTEETRNKVRQFVNDGRLEFISGGWCMNDEASTHYNSIIDQHSLGAEFLHDQFGECARPKIGWQIDPFGHSRELASIFAQMGFDGMFFRRSDYEDLNKRQKTKTLEMVWKASDNLDHQSWLFTGIAIRAYAPPPSFCNDITCNDPPIMDDPRLHDYNVPERVQAFINVSHDEAQYYATNHIMQCMGDDFRYENANAYFKNLDKLIKYVNDQQANSSDVNVFYSTPSCYLYALNKAGRTWTSKSDDFFPYARTPHGFQTGYYTSRPALKGFERHANNILQSSRQLNALANLNQRNTLFLLSEPMGVVQHHDAISGTEKQEVADDYAQRLSAGIDSIMGVINDAYSKLLPKNQETSPSAPQFLCQYANISECLPIEGVERFTLTLWNPTIHPVTHLAHVPVTKDYTIRDPVGQTITAEYLPISSITARIPGRTSSAAHQLIFKAEVPALGFSTFFFEVKTNEELKEKRKVKIIHNDSCTLENEHLRVEFDDQGNMHKIINKDKQIGITLASQGLYWYPSYPGNDSKLDDFQPSGAYIFRPWSQEAGPANDSRTIICTLTETVQSALIIYNDWASFEVSLHPGSLVVEVEWTVGPIAIDDNIGKEVIMRYDTDIQSAATFYTDANGREVLQRIRDYRPTWNYTVTEPVSGNYYPVNSRIWIKDGTRQFTVLTDRSQGGSSMKDGSIETMIHRRILHDDKLDVSEPLNETAYGQGLVVRGRQSLILEPPATSALLHRVNAQNMYMHTLSTYAIPQLSYADYSNKYRQTWSALSNAMPVNVHLLTFDQLELKKYLVRVEHFFELNEDAVYSQPVTFDFQSLFNSLGTIKDSLELTLGANLPLIDLHRLVWVTSEGEASNNTAKHSSLTDTMITLNPMQIRTFQVTLQ